MEEKNHIGKKVPMWYSDFAFHVGNHVGICQMLTQVRKTGKIPGPYSIADVILKNCKSELLYMLAELFSSTIF